MEGTNIITAGTNTFAKNKKLASTLRSNKVTILYLIKHGLNRIMWQHSAVRSEL
jgi:hypothetical protein